MVDNSFFLGTRATPKTTEEFPVIDCKEQTSENSVSQEAMDSFQFDSERFFKTYGENAPEEISKFLNKDLIDSDPEGFNKLYTVLLRRLCLECDKRLPLKSLVRVIEGDNVEEREEIISFLESTGLMEQTYKTFKMIRMLPNLND
jgi:hypothetical protein